MYLATNKFGTSQMFTDEDILKDGSKIYIFNCACLTIHSETLGWANKHNKYIVTDINAANIVIVLGCQVTDLAILNDLNTIDKLKKLHPTKRFFIGGCIAQRFDLGGDQYDRIDILYSDYSPINDTNLVHWQVPFWSTAVDSTHFLRNDKIFHNLRIGKGCHGKCTYCTIRVTRKNPVILDINKLTDQIIDNRDKVIVPTADTILPNQIEQIYHIAKNSNIKFALRNVEPDNAMKCEDMLLELAKLDLLHTIHIPIQSNNIGVLRAMNRSIDSTISVVTLAHKLRELGVFTATNIIISYPGEDDNHDNIYELFEHVAWNPYWDGKFDLKTARARMDKYIPHYQICLA